MTPFFALPGRRLRCPVPNFAIVLGLLQSLATAQSPRELLSRPDKVELADEYGVVATTGAEFGLSWMWWWHRISAGWGAVRPKVAQLVVYDPSNGAVISLQGGQRTWTPASVSQELEVNRLRFAQQRFVDQDSQVVILKVQNRSDEPRKLRLYFVGKPEGRVSISLDQERNAIVLTETKDFGKRYVPGQLILHQWIGCSRPITGWGVGSFTGDLEKLFGGDLGTGVFINDANIRKYVSSYEGAGYQYAFQVNLGLAPGEEQALTLANTFHTNAASGAERNRMLVRDAAALLKAKQARQWNYYENEVPALVTPDEKLNRLWYHLWYVLNSNRVRKGAAVKADFNVPSKFGYWGCYVWDTAFHVLGQTYLNEKVIAKDSLRALLSIQYPNGFLPVNTGAEHHEVITPDGTYYLARADFYDYQEQVHPFLSRLEFRHPNPHIWGVPQARGQVDVLEKTQLPIPAMAAWELYQATGDKAFLAEIFPALAKYDDWMWRRRNTGDGLVVFHHGDETGMDNAVRQLPLPVKTVDGSVAALIQRKVLAEIARIGGREDDVAKFSQRAETTARSINEKMWNEQTSFFHDLSTQDLKRSQKSLTGFLPLLAGIVSPGRSEALLKHLKDPNEFWTPHPVPSLSRDDPDYDAQTWGWNGPAWVPTNWFVMEGFARAGHVEAANEILAKTVDMMSKPAGYPSASEQYNSATGVPFGVPDYSWCSVVNHYVVKWVAGIRPDAAADRVVVAPHLLKGWESLRLSKVRFGGHTLDLSVDYSGGKRSATLTHQAARALHVELELPAPRRVREVRVGDKVFWNYQAAGAVVRVTISLRNEQKTVEAVFE